MKKGIALIAVLFMAFTITGCSDKASQEDATTSDLDIVPLLIDRQILTDAVWGEGIDVPENVACVAGSQITFKDMVNPLSIMKNSGASAVNLTPAVVTSSLNIYINENEGENRAESCPAGDLYYIVSASAETPVDVEAIGEGCTDLAEIASEEAVAYPNSGKITAHFEPYEVDLDVVDLTKEEASDEVTVEGETEETTDDNTDTSDPNKIPQKMFKLVIDSCSE